MTNRHRKEGARSVDSIDAAILKELRADSRLPVTTLATLVGRSRTAVQARIDRMQEDGTILGFTVRVPDTNTNSNEIGALISVHVQIRRQANTLVRRFQKMPEVLSCLSVTGAPAFVLLLAKCPSDRLKEIVETIYEANGVTKTDTIMVLHTDF